MAANHATSSYFLALKNEPRLTMQINTSIAAMAVDNKNSTLLYCSEDCLLLINEQGTEMLNMKRNFKVSDMCFSSFLNQFLILSYKPDCALYSLDPSTHELKQIKKFTRIIWSCTCYDKTLIVSEADQGSKIEVYDLSADHWNAVQIFTAPLSCKMDEQIEKIRFNSDGSRLGVILRKGSQSNYYHWFELRNPNNMTVVSSTTPDLGDDQWCWLLPLPNQQFLATLWRKKKLFLFDSHGVLQETTEYDTNVKFLNSTALINSSCLAVQTWKPDELRFYNL
ncbi:unnamed protein product [Adineta steineri]|uniref:Uncharacterized protein n=2 Tax=Adineta steineri TaxID=433720 RepID=A0A818KN04_9BILA|nr:unnamed protein product [Adineta steineri]CAF3557873.1 unnamed protein product [Adineta steineri]